MYYLEKTEYQEKNQLIEESLYVQGNGYLGLRGCFEEKYPHGNTIRGTYINGLYERVPMNHAEFAHGFPEEHDRQPRIMDFQTCEVFLDGERAQLIQGKTSQYSRRLNFENGESIRSYCYHTDNGKKALLTFKRVVSLECPSLAVLVTEVNYDGAIELISVIDGDIENYSDHKDPRTARGQTKLLEYEKGEIEEDTCVMTLKTTQSHIKVTALINHVINHHSVNVSHENRSKQLITRVNGKGNIRLEKWCFVSDSLRQAEPEKYLRKLSKEFTFETYESLTKRQAHQLGMFWKRTQISIEGDDTAAFATRFMQFQLLQNVGVDAYSNVSAKGLSGEGYEGHYFWDTEIYIFPVILLTDPKRAKKLLEYRYKRLPESREEARKLGHLKGAKYAWRTISGIESSGYFPAGTAQYHINADIAYAFIQYYQATNDLAFMAKKGLEVLIETGRVFMDMGHYHDGHFHIYDVTGPDEYTAIVNDNYYTNVMVAHHFKWLNIIYQRLLHSPYKDIVKDKCMHIFLEDDEIEQMKKASERMYYPMDKDKSFYAQDDSFLSKPVWPFENEDYMKRPLLLNYHPLAIYRHQVLKQADSLLAHMLLEEEVTESQMKKGYEYYEKVTTHDSSLSSCIYGIMAARLGDIEKAYDYLHESWVMDLKDTHRNTKDGLHMANISGSLLGVIYGFAGVRIIEEKLYIRPQKPSKWDAYSFYIYFKGRHIKIEVADKCRITCLSGKPLSIYINDACYELKKEIEYDYQSRQTLTHL